MQFARLCVISFLYFACSTCFAQECTSRMIVDPFDSKTTVGIDGLQAEDFDLRIGKTTIPVVSATQKFNNRVVVLLEITGRNESPEIAQLVNRVAQMVRQAPVLKPVAFGIFGERPMFADTFSVTAEERAAKVDQLMEQAPTLGKHPAVFDSLHAALSVFGSHQPGDTIVLISDGEDVKSARNANDLAREFSAAGVRLLFMMRPSGGMARVPSRQFRWAPDGNMNWRRSPGRVALASLSSTTGGAFSGVNEHFFEFAWAGYMLEVKPPSDLYKTRGVKLELRGPAAKAHKQALIYFPENLPPCDAIPSTAQGH